MSPTSSQNIFRTYLNLNPSQHSKNLKTGDVVNNYFIDKKVIKTTIKNFWKEKTSCFYKEAKKWKILTALITTQWIILMAIGFLLIGIASYPYPISTQQITPSGSSDPHFLNINAELVNGIFNKFSAQQILIMRIAGGAIIGTTILINWAFVIYASLHKPSFYNVVLKDTNIKYNIRFAMILYAICFTSLLAHAIFHAVLNEMILLSHYSLYVEPTKKNEQLKVNENPSLNE